MNKERIYRRTHQLFFSEVMRFKIVINSSIHINSSYFYKKIMRIVFLILIKNVCFVYKYHAIIINQ